LRARRVQRVSPLELLQHRYIAGGWANVALLVAGSKNLQANIDHKIRIPTLGLGPVARAYHVGTCGRLEILLKSKSELDNTAADRDLYSGLIPLHVLHHAVEGPIFGLGMIEELARHGYKISPGSLYPLLQGLEKKGYLRSTEKRNGKSLRRVYRATQLGRKALGASKGKVRELFRELVEGD
jgi:PadR family transcriptional regulator PadR